ncbi:pyridoxal-phosphate dependent enzyme [Kangiella sp. HD9-110m-PIT-SAG07]|nr:pyridoxal-phosphate dependent enzyme [Kangiella sp. HD9-110m-PIT-SAG07]
MITLNSSPIHAVSWKLADELSVSIDIKRDDLLHPVVSGNKWRKLKYLIEDARSKQSQHIISMGGNWSNHLHALAFVGNELSINTHAFVRAHKEQSLTPTLNDCQQWGMTFDFTSRKEYAELRQERTWDRYHEQFPNSYWIGEGGFSELAIQGVKDIACDVKKEYDYIFVGCGSGATLCGLAQAFPSSRIVGVAAFSGAEYLQPQLKKNIATELDNWTLDTEHHCGGFAKAIVELEELISAIELNNDFKLDTVYNGKVFYALKTWLESGKLPLNSRVLVIHTGGLQGTREV